MNNDRCKRIVDQIQTLSNLQIDELFRILHMNQCEYTINNNGVFINLSWVSDAILDKIDKFIDFCHKSSNELEKFETIRTQYKHDIDTYREQSNINKTDCKIIKHINEIDDKKISRVSSTMKFYLLKKKYSKSNTVTIYNEPELIKEDYIL